jgi:hypothetical protein
MGKEFAKLLLDNPATPVEIDPAIKVSNIKNPACVIIAGFSTRRVVDAVRNYTDDQGYKKEVGYIVVVEPNISRFHATIQREWIGDLVDDKNVHIIVGVEPENLHGHLYQIMTAHDGGRVSNAGRSQAPEFVIDPFSFDGQSAKPILTAVQETAKSVFLAMGCASDSHYRWERMIQNEKNLQDCYKIKPLFDKFKGKTVVVLGAGPSMEDFIKYNEVYDLQNKSLIIACDAALKRLLKHNIKPHIVVRCERKETLIFDGIKKEDTAGIYYAGYPWCAPAYFNLFEKSFMVFRDNGVCKWTGYDPGSANGGVSSANAALELAYLFGAEDIVVSGVDLCFLGGKSHIEGTEVEFDIEKSKPKWTEIAGNSGNKVTTIPVWNRCLKEYEGATHRNPGRKVYNTSLNGAKISGMEVKGWDSLAELFKYDVNAVKTIENNLEKHTPAYAEELSKRREKTVTVLKECEKAMGKFFGNIEDTMETALREEKKIMEQIKKVQVPSDFFNAYEGAKGSLIQLFSDPCRQVDNLKVGMFTKELFSLVVLDVCQHDFFVTENKLFFLRNVVKPEHERLKQYIWMNISLISELYHYTKALIDLIEHGKFIEEVKNAEIMDVQMEVTE